MPVIGRLDGQVDEVIIKPISERRRGELTPADETTDTQPDTPAPPQTITNQTPPSDESSAEADELPVWLL
jgi:hypothetical protein